LRKRHFLLIALAAVSALLLILRPDACSLRGEQKSTPPPHVNRTTLPPQLAEKPDLMRLATFNIRQFSSNSRDDWELARICDVLDDFDIVAMQEVFDTKALDRCAAEMKKRGLSFSWLASRKVGTRRWKEYYVFFYRSDRVKALDKGTTYPDRESVFIREPFWASFRCGKFDFTLITVHVLMKTPKAPERKKELDALARIYRMVQDGDEKENDVILLGDFNENADSKRFEKLRAVETMHMLNDGLKTNIYDSLSIDNIMFQDRYTAREYAGKCGVLKFDVHMFGDDDRAARLAVSDHRPFWALFRTDRKDDD